MGKALNVWTFAVLTRDTRLLLCLRSARCWDLLPTIMAVCVCAADAVTRLAVTRW